MSCPRCHSLVLQNFEDPYCYACGWRENKPLAIEIRDAYSRKAKCLECLGPREAGYDFCPKCRAWKKKNSDERMSHG